MCPKKSPKFLPNFPHDFPLKQKNLVDVSGVYIYIYIFFFFFLLGEGESSVVTEQYYKGVEVSPLN